MPKLILSTFETLIWNTPKKYLNEELYKIKRKITMRRSYYNRIEQRKYERYT